MFLVKFLEQCLYFSCSERTLFILCSNYYFISPVNTLGEGAVQKLASKWICRLHSKKCGPLGRTKDST